MDWLESFKSFLSAKNVCAVLLLYVIYFFIHPIFLSPLRKIPGPWYATLTKWWLVRITVRGIRAKTIHGLHQKYGPWVRIAPNEVSTCDPEAIVPIYGVGSSHVKTEFYTYQLRGEPELFTMSDRKQHAKRRRELSHLFSMSTISEYEPVIAKQVKICMDAIADQGRKGETSNLYDWWHYLSMDIICDLAFGSTFNMLRDGATNAYIKDLYGSLQIEPVRWHFGWLNRYAAYAPLKFVRDAEACSVRAMNRGGKIVREYMANNANNNNNDSSEKKNKTRRKDLLQKMLDARDSDGAPLSIAALNTEAAGFILAGSHTTSSSLTWAVWRILSSPSIHTRLLDELATALTSANVPHDAIPSHSLLEPLPYFNAVIKEALRIDTAVPGSTPRYVPEGGSSINGVYLPAGTIVSTQAYSCHRDSEAFPDPEVFRPERWLDAGETARMKRLYIPYGADGPRKCIGMHLANMELRVILASLFWRFEIKGVGDVREVERGMELDEFWLANPLGQRLDVLVEERR